ncbi:hypothetical protein ACIBX3_60445, partial [Nonomuraea sp. NPDC049480]
MAPKRTRLAAVAGLLLLLSAAFGLIQAGLIDQSLFNHASFADSPFSEGLHTISPGIDVDADQLLTFVGGHVLWSFAGPIAVTEACAPGRPTGRGWDGLGGDAAPGHGRDLRPPCRARPLGLAGHRGGAAEPGVAGSAAALGAAPRGRAGWPENRTLTWARQHHRGALRRGDRVRDCQVAG